MTAVQLELYPTQLRQHVLGTIRVPATTSAPFHPSISSSRVSMVHTGSPLPSPTGVWHSAPTPKLKTADRRKTLFNPKSPHTSTYPMIFTVPPVLARLLAYLPWEDFLPLTRTCTALRHLLSNHELRDIVLTGFVDGYGYCLRMGDPALRDGLTEISVTWKDLDMLVTSQGIPLHSYPTHALAALSTLSPFPSGETKRLMQLSLAHSRFVLLLQGLAHCSSRPVALEPEPDSSSSFSHFDATGSRRVSRVESRFTTGKLTSGGKPRELHFPAPLSYASSRADLSSSLAPCAQPPRPGFPIAIRKSSASTASTPPPSIPRIKHAKRRSFLSRSSLNPLPAPVEPTALKHYSTSWRRSLIKATSRVSLQLHSRQASAPGSLARLPTSGSISEDEGHYTDMSDLGELRRPFATRTSSSSDSSLRLGSSSYQTSPSPRGSSHSDIPATKHAIEPTSTISTSTHDLRLATSRVRAPILRVFVPCTQLDRRSVIRACEDQLVGAGLWEHMSVGDVVCNLGHVPSSQGSSSTASDGEEEVIERPSRHTRTFRPHGDTTWLIFGGDALVPVSVPGDRLPILDPLSLPSPWYYEHLRPPTQRYMPQPHLRIILNRLPPFSRSQANPHMTLLHLVTPVRSPHSIGGIVLVKKWVWTARISGGGNNLSAYAAAGHKAHTPPPNLGPGIGIGWQGEWILEGEGTREGKQVLLDCIFGVDVRQREWEVVREKSGGGKVWLRLVYSDHGQDRSDPL